MSSPGKYITAPRYNLQYSRTIVGLELFFHALVCIAIVQTVHDWWMLGMLLLYVLIAIHYFQRASIRSEFPVGSAIELRGNPSRLIWYDGESQQSYLDHDIRCIMTRWFVLLQLGKIGQRKNKLLLADSFDDNSHYTRFRREIIEKTEC